ncbi:MAG: alpha/beta fold hydrolase [Burkholderiales bacterium]
MTQTGTIEHGFAGVNGVRLHYARLGEGPLMLFLHGFPEFWRGWKKPLEYFGARGWCALAPDQRGYNLSERPAAVEQYRVRLLIEDIRQLAQRFTRGRFVLAAHDWGGAVAWGFAMAHPELLSHLVIVNSPHPYTFWRELAGNPAQQQASAYMLLLRDAKAERVLSQDGYAKLWKLAFGSGSPQFSEEDRAAYFEAWAQPGALTGGLNWYRASPLYPPAASDPGASRLSLEAKDFMVRVPTLVIWGEADKALLPGCLDGLEACVPDLRVVRVPGASHWIVHERPQWVCGEIERFVGFNKR